MNEKLQYASMLEIPTTTCNVTIKPIKKKRAKKQKDVSPETVKQELLEKVNASSEQAEEEMATEQTSLILPQEEEVQPSQELVESAVVTKKMKKPFKLSIIGVQLAIVTLLIGVIALTNLLNANSGINVFMKSLFSPSTQLTIDEREFNEFTPVISFSEEQTLLENGVITISGEGSVYSPCNGKVLSVVKLDDGSYTVEIAHSENFSTRIGGLTFVYMLEGEEVYANIPVGYMGEFGVEMCFLGADGAIITGYEVVDGAVIWAV